MKVGDSVRIKNGPPGVMTVIRMFNWLGRQKIVAEDAEGQHWKDYVEVFEPDLLTPAISTVEFMPPIPKTLKSQAAGIYIGIDPGQNGGLAAVNGSGRVLCAIAMPDTERDVWNWFYQWSTYSSSNPGFMVGDIYACIELVHSMPQQGVASSFKFGKHFGSVRMAAIAAGLSIQGVQPVKWMRSMGISPATKKKVKTKKGKIKLKVDKVAHKNNLKARAQEVFPKQNVTLKTADALLLAEYCRRMHKGIIS